MAWALVFSKAIFSNTLEELEKVSNCMPFVTTISRRIYVVSKGHVGAPN
jgi:hypothetical protein